MLIDIRNLRVILGGKAILHGVNLSLGAGEVYGLIGPNGAGKSTTIAAVLGLVEVGGGTVRVLGADHRLATDSGAGGAAYGRLAGNRAVVFTYLFPSQRSMRCRLSFLPRHWL